MGWLAPGESSSDGLVLGAYSLCCSYIVHMTYVPSSRFKKELGERERLSWGE